MSCHHHQDQTIAGLNMTLELLIATVMVLLTVGIHAIGLILLGHMIEMADHRPDGTVRVSPLNPRGAWLTISLVLGLFFIHGLEIWSYAFLFYLIGAVSDLREAIYFSTISYGSIGYGDSSIHPKWKLLGAIEGVNGAILLGWSIAFFVTMMEHLLPRTRRTRVRFK